MPLGCALGCGLLGCATILQLSPTLTCSVIIIIRRANTEDATFDHEGNVANYRGAKLTTAARSISACGKQASSGTSVRTPTTSSWEWCARRGMGSKGSRAVGDATPPGHAAAVSRGREDHRTMRTEQESVKLLVPHREGVGLAVARRPSTPRAGVAAAA